MDGGGSLFTWLIDGLASALDSASASCESSRRDVHIPETNLFFPHLHHLGPKMNEFQTALICTKLGKPCVRGSVSWSGSCDVILEFECLVVWYWMASCSQQRD